MEIVKFPSHGGFSVRSIITFALTVIITALLWATLTHSTPVNAQATNATWNDDSILYDSHGFNKIENFNDTTNTIPDGSTVYQTVPQENGSSRSQRVFIIYFSPGLDPPTATTAKYVEFDYSSSQALSNPENQRDITLTPRGEESELSSCSVGGIGWIICPISVFLAEAMDNIFNILSEMIKVQPPILGDTNNSLYIAWDVMRNIANIAFVIAFLIIIYSQVTSIGVSNYGLKRLIPRLVISAVLVNISFFISALAIDLSNILGFSIQDIFNGIRENLFSMTNDSVGNDSVATETWTAVTAVILAGGGLLLGGVYFAAAGGLYLLLPLLLGLLLTIIFVVIVLAARQAIIICLVILAPLAFVAYLLPNTEKWFDKWKDLFMTMLIFFPAFSLVFGGSQLAGQIIIQNAGDNIIMLLFGMAVQIAPLVVTPLILKFSGSLLGRIAQIANDPRRGLLDRSKNWAQSRAEHARQQNIARGARLKNPASWGAGMVKSQDFRKRRLKDRTDTWKQYGDNLYESDGRTEAIRENAHDAHLGKEIIENRHKAHLTSKATITGSRLNVRTIELEEAKVAAERASAQSGDMISGYRAGAYETGSTEQSAHLAGLQRRMAENVIETAAWKQGEQANQYVQQRNISERMRGDEKLLDIAQGYGTPEIQHIARERAQANAVATLSKLNRDARENTITLMETEAVEAGDTVKDYAIKKVIAKANSANADERNSVLNSRLEAALEIAASDGQVTVFDEARSSEFIDQSIVDAVVARHVGDMKSKGGFHIQAMPNLSLQRYIADFHAGERPESEQTLDDVRAAFFQDQKMARLGTFSNTNAANLGGVKFGAFAKLADDILTDDPRDNLLAAIPRNADGTFVNSNDKAMVERIFESLRDGLSDPSTRATMTDRLAQARDMEEKLRSEFFPSQPPLNLSDSERAEAGGDIRPAPMDQNQLSSDTDVDPTDGSPSDEDNN